MNGRHAKYDFYALPSSEQTIWRVFALKTASGTYLSGRARAGNDPEEP
jgi:hypothetical protein